MTNEAKVNKKEREKRGRWRREGGFTRVVPDMRLAG